jgi:hypothetical protein
MDSSARAHSWRINIGLILVWSTVTACLTYARLSNENFGAQGDLPVHYHLLRTFARCVEEGQWWPRWAGLLDGGRGDAIFTFYPPLTYWLGLASIKLGGLSLLGALKFIAAFSIFFAQCSAYQFARVFFARKQSLLVSVGYALLPAYALIALHRAFLPNALALSLVPLFLLGAYELLDAQRPRKGWMLFTLAGSALILTHVITTYLCGWLLLFLLISHAQPRRWLPVLLAGAAMLALTCFFWLPQQLEMRWVQVGLQLTQQDFKNYLLFAPAAQNTPYRQAWADLNAIASWATVLQSALAASLALLFWRVPLVPAQRTLLRWTICVASFGLLISLPWSAPLWHIVPGLPYLQFPWRWQPLTALSIAALAALAWQNWPQLPRQRRLVLSAFATLLFLSVSVITFNLVRSDNARLTQKELLAQLNERTFAPIPFAEARELPDAIKDLRLAITANQVFFRPQTADQFVYPATENYGGLTILNGRGTVTASTLNNESRRFQINAEEPLQARFETYAYPHWHAQLDGQELPLRTEAESGLILLDVPAGKHELSFEFAPRSLAHRLGRGVSLLAWLGFAAWLAWLGFRQRKNRFADEAD